MDDAFAEKMRQAQALLDAADGIVAGSNGGDDELKKTGAGAIHVPRQDGSMPQVRTVSFDPTKGALGLGLRARKDWVPLVDGGTTPDNYATELGRFNGEAGQRVERTGMATVGDLVVAVGEADMCGKPHNEVIGLIKNAARCTSIRNMP
eukprot:SAG31_NODE_736_length_12477_cov_60.959363_4_plen_149_part_00